MHADEANSNTGPTPSSEPSLICYDTQTGVKSPEQEKSLGYPHYLVKGDAVVDHLL
ncbi:hypothetical protein D9613_012544 [Agrocybe pediades]|uniref:Uncharacterized protein n=1 Tax=Agrocybe pediades TaxID=84607 RepID=A0A8H4QRY5_9AGAR|nr:hypothetical protein D9613_012544 [Agrocybe pediades]